jgi:hypothetical protein
MAMLPNTKRILELTRSELINEINEYFDRCDKDTKPYLTIGLAQHLKVSKQLLVDIRADRVKAFVGFHHKETLILAQERIELYLAERLFDKDDKKVTSSIFTLKTNHGWHDRDKIDISNIQEIKINFK